MQNKFKAIISDLDGCLLETKDIHFRALNKALSEVCGFEISYEDHIKTYDGLPTLKKLELLKFNGFGVTNTQKIVELKNQYTNLELSKIEEDPRLIELFKFLSDNFEHVLVASNAIRDTVDISLEKLGIDHLIDRAYNNQEIKQAKPNPEIYLKAMVDFSLRPQDCLIIEDSVHGREAAIASGATLVPVNNPKDLTIEKIKKYMNGSKNLDTRWTDDNLNIVIPMAGNGSRFADAGYTFPKPLIDVAGKPMIQRVVESLNIKANYIYIVRKEHYEKYALDAMLNLITPGCKIIQLDEVTDGAARTVLLAEKYIDNDQPLIICNSDQIIDWNPNLSMYKFMNYKPLDGMILTFESTHPKWSYVKMEGDLAVEVAEKRPISNNATVGVYIYKQGKMFVESAYKMIDKNIRVNNEFYVAPTINELIQDGKKFSVQDVNSMYGVGTPEDLQHYLNSL